MATFKEHLQKHSQRVAYHVKKHHKKYIFGIVGGAIALKLVLTFIASLGLYEGYGAFAQEITGDEIKQEIPLENINTLEETGTNLTGEVQTGTNLTGEVQTGTNLTGEVQTGTNLTGEVQTGTNLTGEVQTGTNLTGEVQTGTNLTGEVQTGTNLTGEVQTGTNLTGAFTPEPQNQNIICNNSNFNFINPLSGSKLKGLINFSWTYSGSNCSGRNFDIYLRDHNSQRIKIGTSSYLNTRFQFNSNQLYSGFYNILGNSGNIIYTGQYSGINAKQYNTYKIRFIDQNQNIIYTGNVFTIDNELPEITGITMEFTGNYNSGYIGLSGVVNLNFTAMEDLTGIIVNILGTNAALINKSGLTYKYSLSLSNQNASGNIYANISFSDLVYNTGLKYLTSQVIFDKGIPALNYIVFTGTYTGLDVVRSGSEPTKYEFTYTLSGSQTGVKLTGNNYTYTGLLNVTGLNQNQIYNFILKLADFANNILAIGGKISFTTGGQVSFTYQTITLSTTTGNNVINVSTGSTGTVSSIIKQEVIKFNECRDEIKTTAINIKINNQDIKINMPNFEKSYVRKIVNAFTIVIMDKLQKTTLTKQDLEAIIEKFDDFLIILKLVREDENQCKQNLSNYHIRLFQKTLDEYNISLE